MEFTEAEKAEVATLDRAMRDCRMALADYVVAQVRLEAQKAAAFAAMAEAEKRLRDRVALAFQVRGLSLEDPTKRYEVDTFTQTVTVVEKAPTAPPAAG